LRSSSTGIKATSIAADASASVSTPVLGATINSIGTPKALCQLVSEISRDATRAPARTLDDEQGGHFRSERDTEAKLARRDEFFHSSLLSLGTGGG
jgi:hypothetical protein